MATKSAKKKPVAKKLPKISIPERTKSEKGMVKCLGWCGKEFMSKDKVNIRFCSKCAAKKDAVQHSISLNRFITVETDW